MIFPELPIAPTDPILGLAQLFALDEAPTKVDLGIGMYKNELGKVPVLRSVKSAERWLVENQESKSYLSAVGNSEFNRLTGELLLGAASDACGRSQTMQTPGGTGALRIAADLLRNVRPQTRIFIPAQTWANHHGIFAAAGLEIIPFPYYDVARAELRLEAMLAALGDMTANDAVLLHGCCHNPTGADPDLQQWERIAGILTRTGALPVIDLAYQGFAMGVREDAAAVALLATQLPELLIASSYSKNFGLYRERVGALTLIGARQSDALNARAHATTAARTNYSMPPDHGAAIVARILGDEELRAEWEEEVAHMRQRIQAMRMQLADCLQRFGADEFRFLTRQHGMFALLGLAPDATERLRKQHHVHLASAGRMNLAGLTAESVERVATAIIALTRAGV